VVREHTEEAKRFYNSATWKKARKNYIERPEVAGLCEHCLKQGLYESGYIVDHIVEIDSSNINDTNITLNPENFHTYVYSIITERHSVRRIRVVRKKVMGLIVVGNTFL